MPPEALLALCSALKSSAMIVSRTSVQACLRPPPPLIRQDSIRHKGDPTPTPADAACKAVTQWRLQSCCFWHIGWAGCHCSTYTGVFGFVSCRLSHPCRGASAVTQPADGTPACSCFGPVNATPRAAIVIMARMPHVSPRYTTS